MSKKATLGRVAFVGAGPGDEGLLTLRAAERLAEVRGLYLGGGLAYGALKAELAELLLAYFADARGKYSALIADRAYLDQVLAQGAQKARAIAAPVLKRMRKAVGIDA